MDPTQEPASDEIKDLKRRLAEAEAALQALNGKNHPPRRKRTTKKDSPTPSIGEERFHSLFENMTEGFTLNEIILDADGKTCDYRFIEINPAFERLTGLKRDDVIGRGLSTILPESERHWLKVFNQVAASGKPLQIEDYSPNLDRHFRIYAYSPAPDIFAAVFMDITPHKKLEQQLNQAANKYSTLFNSTSDGVLIHNLEGEVVEVNDAYCQMSGYTRDELIHMPVSMLEAHLSPAEVATRIQKLLSQEGHDSFESQHRRKDGSIFDVDVTALYYDLEGGRIAIFVRDITERKQAEGKIHTSENMLRAVLDQMPSGVTVRDARTGELLLANNRAHQLMGHLVDNASDFIHYHGLHSDGRSYTKDEWPVSRSMTTGEMVNGEEIEFIQPDGSHIMLGFSSAPIRDAEGNIIMGVNTFQDITARKEAEKRLAYLASFPERNPNPIVEVDVTGKINYANPTAVRLLPGLLKQGLSHPWLADLDSIAHRFQYGDTDIVVRDVGIGNQWYQQSLHYFEGEGFIRIYGIEITRRRRAEIALRSSEQRLARAQEIAGLGSWELDLTNNHLAWSDEVYRLFGFQPDEFAATYEAFLEGVHPDDRAAVDAAYTNSVRDGLDSYEIDHRLVDHATGEVRYVHEKCVHIRDESGKIIRSEGMVHDITDRTLASQALQNARNEMEKRVQERTSELKYTNLLLEAEVHERQETQVKLESNVQELQVLEEELRNNNDLLMEAQKILETERLRYQDLFDFAPDGYLVTDSDGRILNANHIASAMLQLSHTHLLGKPLLVYIAAEDHASFNHTLIDFKRGRQVESRELKLIGRNKTPVTAAVTITAALDETRQRTLRWALRDITEQKHAEELIRQNSARNAVLSQISQSLAEASLDEKAILDFVVKAISQLVGDSCTIILASADGQWLDPVAWYHNNPEARQLQNELVSSSARHPATDGPSGTVYRTGQPLLVEKVEHPLDPSMISPVYRRYAEQVGISSMLIVPLHISSQTIGTLGISRDRDGHPYSADDQALLKILAERTSQAIHNARLYQELQVSLQNEKETHAQLLQSEKFAAVGRLLASITHEINNPLQTIKNCLYLSQADMPPGTPVYEYLKMATTETDRLSNLVAQLREIYRPPTQGQARKLYLPTLLGEVQALLAGYLHEKHISWEITPSDSALLSSVVVEGVPDQLKQVFLNLSLNAIDAMDSSAGGSLTIDIFLSPDRSEVGIRLCDTGPGLPQEVKDKLFEPFITTKEKGLGLGLMICYDIVKKHNGRIEVESEAGAGATFTVWLPARPA